MVKLAVRSEIPPPLELLCLNALWTMREGNVRDVQGALSPSRPLAYTTVMTLLDRLERKGAVSRRKVGRAFVYAPRVSRDCVQRLALKEFLDGFFDGSEARLLAFLQSMHPAQAAAETGPRVERLDAALL